MSTAFEAPRTVVTMDVTMWPEFGRTKLVKAIEEVQAEVEAALKGAAAAAAGGWTQELLEQALSMLFASGNVAQVAAVRQAIGNGGVITREQVYDVSGYDVEARSLKGFTRPTNRVTKRLKKDGLLPETAGDLLTTGYPGGTGWARTTGFQVPVELVAEPTADSA